MSEKKQNKATQVATSETVDERVYTLSRPFTFEGKEYTELLLDFDSLSGEDLLSCESQLKTVTDASEFIPMKEISKPYLTLVVARAAKVPFELIQNLPAKDFSKVTLRAQNFLLG
ncbi:hypothetical protein ERICV_05133 [Paenibacillus phage phiERICV]|uniref:Phage tail assembly protein n=1 Tax=Paenibacillus larvae subsp. larvae TaxID=147375 RepID=A0A6C0QMU4_9BACL|nr:phage tail assembly protein [Paenibacillus larvae]QHZ50032.1 hypothetical protein ERICV_00855 [Paenibacillus larvae subsp. larvae]QHZ54117.1 hypothetical protein ERICV_05133 [Paenibacillus phage phiERICV]